MIDTQRLGALLRALIREDTFVARLRTPAAGAVRAVSPIGPELAPPRGEAAKDEHAPGEADRRGLPVLRDAARALRDDVRAGPGRGDTLAAASTDAHPLPSGATRVTLGGSPVALGAHGPRSAALELSDTGRVLLAALRADPASTPVTPPGSAMQPISGAAVSVRTPQQQAIAPRGPLISVPPHSEVATDRLALQLKDAVEFSGVFYEAHLAQWADDMRPRALLAHEPQSRWPVAHEIARAATGPDAAPSDYATPLLRQQLEVLDTGRFLWQGELWPGQRGMLVIDEEDAEASHAGADQPAGPRWRMRLSLSFAHLGTIEASLGLAGDSVDLTLRCDDPAVVGQLRSAAPVLRVAIAERALDLATLTISNEPDSMLGSPFA